MLAWVAAAIRAVLDAAVAAGGPFEDCEAWTYSSRGGSPAVIGDFVKSAYSGYADVVLTLIARTTPEGWVSLSGIASYAGTSPDPTVYEQVQGVVIVDADGNLLCWADLPTILSMGGTGSVLNLTLDIGINLIQPAGLLVVS